MENIGIGEDEHQAPALRRRLPEIVAEYDAKRAALKEAIQTFEQATAAVKAACAMEGTYGGDIFYRNVSPSVSSHAAEAALLSSAWRHVYNGLQIASIAPARDRDRFATFLEKPDPFTIENLREQFGEYILDPRFHILRGLAECFIKLDPAFKSHSKVKIGVKGLPKKIIIRMCGTYYGDKYGFAQVADVLNALAAYRGEPRWEYQDVKRLHTLAVEGEAMWWGGTLKIFQNGNCHMIFDKHALLEINQALAEFYGDVLPDAPATDAKPQPGTAVSKDLAYYPTPRAVMEIIGDRFTLDKADRILEPSCGDGRIMDWLAKAAPDARVTGIEYDGGRVAEARAKGHAVRQANFLQVEPDPVFDYVFMNPPFCQWEKHLDHARKFLRKADPNDRWNQGGTLICILPAAANDDKRFGDPNHRGWYDLPVASFRESGTNVCTGYVVLGPGTDKLKKHRAGNRPGMR